MTVRESVRLLAVRAVMTAVPGAPPAVTRPLSFTETMSGALLLQVMVSWAAFSGVMEADRARVPLGSSSASSPGVMVSPVGSVGATVTSQVAVLELLPSH